MAKTMPKMNTKLPLARFFYAYPCKAKTVKTLIFSSNGHAIFSPLLRLNARLAMTPHALHGTYRCTASILGFETQTRKPAPWAVLWPNQLNSHV